MRSKEALKAHLVTFSSDNAARISSGIVSPQARSYTTTGPPSTETPKSSISNSSDSAYLADIYQDALELKQASEAVAEILDKDPNLELEEHRMLRVRMKHFMEEHIGKMNL